MRVTGLGTSARGTEAKTLCSPTRSSHTPRERTPKKIIAGGESSIALGGAAPEPYVSGKKHIPANHATSLLHYDENAPATSSRTSKGLVRACGSGDMNSVFRVDATKPQSNSPSRPAKKIIRSSTASSTVDLSDSAKSEPARHRKKSLPTGNSTLSLEDSARPQRPITPAKKQHHDKSKSSVCLSGGSVDPVHYTRKPVATVAAKSTVSLTDKAENTSQNSRPNTPGRRRLTGRPDSVSLTDSAPVDPVHRSRRSVQSNTNNSSDVFNTNPSATPSARPVTPRRMILSPASSSSISLVNDTANDKGLTYHSCRKKVTAQTIARATSYEPNKRPLRRSKKSGVSTASGSSVLLTDVVQRDTHVSEPLCATSRRHLTGGQTTIVIS